ncbi:proteasome assembly chaperone 2 isoform X1 [Rattus norvegicus]|uniref:proteasome assembly chaperone 2 isoform X1 n=1 Tax=Rattus norvegicus TaxID=10116 RepID=UPI002FD7A0BA
MLKYKSKSFCEKLLAWAESSCCARIIVLSSSHSYHRTDVQLRSTPFRYLLTPCLQKSVQNKIKSLNWLEMEKSRCIPEMSDSEFCIRIPGGGITKTLYEESCCKEIQMAVLLKFVSEGDNIPDAVSLVEYLNEWLQIIKPCSDGPVASVLPWKIPSSWRLLFGSGLPPALF